jgi:hypothetical protein
MKSLLEAIYSKPRAARADGEKSSITLHRPATPENIQKWKDWWTGNKDHAVFVQRPVQSFE